MAAGSLTFLDTHVAVWLYSGHLDLLSEAAIAAISEGELRISPMVVLEAEYLREIGRLTVRGEEIADGLAAERGVQRDASPFGAIVRRALDLSWTRDPFDRLIVANALAAGGVLVTKDAVIRRESTVAVW